MLKLSKEQTLLNEIFKIIRRGSDRTLLPIGADGFIYRSFERPTALVQDMSIEGVHFQRKWSSPRDIGWKTLAVNLSDLAALGATPAYAQVSLAIPRDFMTEDVLDFYRGMTELADQWRTEVIGGDLSRSSGPWIADLSCTGDTPVILGRSKVSAGDELFVTGPLGHSALGLLQLQENKTEFPLAIAKHKRPRPRLDFLPVLQSGVCRSAIDISDSLVNEIALLAREQKLGFNILEDKIPLHPDSQQIDSKLALDLALWGGEDYELLIAVEPNNRQEFLQQIQSLGLEVFPLGAFNTFGELQLIFNNGKSEVISELKNWSHF